MEEAKKLTNHLIFEQWRNKNLDELNQAENKEYIRATLQSTKLYNDAFCETLQHTTMKEFESLFDAFAEFTKIKAVQCYVNLLNDQVTTRVDKVVQDKRRSLGVSHEAHIEGSIRNPMFDMAKVPLSRPGSASVTEAEDHKRSPKK